MAQLSTIKATRAAIRKARAVYIQGRFGCAEHWLKISKAEALELLETFEPDATPAECEMYSGDFGKVDASGVWLG